MRPLRKRSRTAGRAAPGPGGLRLLGSLQEVRRRRLDFVRNTTREYGDAAVFRMGPKRLFLLSHPDAFRHVLCQRPENYAKGVGLREARPLLGDGLLTVEGEQAVHNRKRVRPAFLGDRQPGYAAAITGAVGSILEGWREVARSGGTVRLDWEMVRLTLDVLDHTLLDAGLERRAEQLHEDLLEMAEWSMNRMTAVVPWPLSLPGRRNRRARRALARLEDWAREAVESRNPEDPGDDVLGLLLAAGATPREIRDELLTFLLAGHETTAMTLTWIWDLLARHPETEARLHEEVDRVLGDRIPTVEDLAGLPWVRAVVDEALRLYPPVWLIPRYSLGDDVVAGYAIPAGSDVLLSVYSLHRHPDFWPEPEAFRPERFLGEKGDWHRAYLPFGAGSRSCLGSGFGLLEARLVLATLARRVRLDRVERGEVPANPSLTLRPSRAIPVRPVLRRPETTAVPPSCRSTTHSGS